MSYKLSELVLKFGGQLIGEDIIIKDIKPLDIADASSISFLTSNKYKKDLEATKAAAVICTNDSVELTTLPKIVCDDPLLYYCFVSQFFNPKKQLIKIIKPSAVIAKTAVIGKNVAIYDNVIIGDNCIIGDNSEIYPNTVINDNVIIGDNCTIYSNVNIYSNVKIGNDCTVHSGVVLGSDGFGYAPDKKGQRHKIPQIGGVVIGNKVEIGANTTIDSGTFVPTRIDDGVVIDNLVQIAHNVTIGAHSTIAACVGIAGSCNIGKHCIMAGGSALADHVDICDYTVVGGFTALGKSITKPDLYMGTYPATPYKDYAKGAVQLRNISDMAQKLKDLEKQLAKIKGDIDGNS